MIVYIVYRVFALSAVINGCILAHYDGALWLRLVGVLLLIAGVRMDTDAVLRTDRKDRTPYQWFCPICRNKGTPVGCESSMEEPVFAFRDHHNRTVHLMEP